MATTSDRVVRAVALLAVLITTAMTAASATNAQAPVAAVWHSQVVRFEYYARGTPFMCRTLQRKVERVLLELGARVQVIRFYCGELSHVVAAEIVLTVPIEASDENLRRLTSFNSKDVLVARLRSQHLPSATDLPLFPAAWKTISLSDMRSDRECELLQQLRQQVLPKLSVQIINDNPQQCSAVVQALVAEDADRLVDSS
ncbi:MAG TPA: hypothetical protein VJS12_20510 [Steroidobacteraceae bacterium]|nr:hypothetical protein [Steroidobacteraceae bacterium]